MSPYLLYVLRHRTLSSNTDAWRGVLAMRQYGGGQGVANGGGHGHWIGWA